MTNGTDRKRTTTSASADAEQVLTPCPAWCDVDHAMWTAEAIRNGNELPTFHGVVLVEDDDLRVSIEIAETGAQPRFWVEHADHSMSLGEAEKVAAAMARGGELLRHPGA